MRIHRWTVWAVVYIALCASAAAQRAASANGVSGVVLGPDGKTVAGARVFLQPSDARAPRTTKTGADGRFRFSVRSGLYDLRAQAQGQWSDWERNIVVHAGQARPVTLRLSRKNPPAAKPPVKLEGKIREWAIPADNSLPHDPAVDPNGNVWLTLQRANQLARLNPDTGEWKFFSAVTLNSGPHGLTSDAEGNIYFTENYVGKIGRVDARTGTVTEYQAPTARDPHTPVFGSDGGLWFTAQQSNLIGRMDPKTGAMREFPVPTANARPYGIVPGPDGALWFCEFGVNKLGRIDPKTGAITEYEVPSADSRPRRLTIAGGAVYFTDFRGGHLGRFDIEQKKFQEWPTPSGAGSQPYGIAADETGQIWYEEFRGNQLIRFNPQTQAFEPYPMPSARSEVRHMVRDAKGRVWMALSGANKVAVVE